ncbi:hypothetical protein [Helicobacter sp. 10-6591]|uniref:hypothetical protein n=1 Tax=Helicobacter sp. 10-6591 TaxID=2004998 RepID=UPI000DCF3CB6|nr:hypothetical protein [Helicobacter sp. 10-6591]RAX56123.1 hypothetical protein CCY97_00925 [Helicobacter sp. 10-6591]
MFDDIFGVVTPWESLLLAVIVCVICIGAFVFVIFMHNPYKKTLISLNTRDSKAFAFAFSSLYPRVLRQNTEAYKIALEIESQLDVYKYSYNPPALNHEVFVLYKKLCKIL